MIDQSLIDWVNENRSKGYNDQQLIAFLKQYGYSQEDAQAAVNYNKNNNNTNNGNSSPQFPSNLNKSPDQINSNNNPIKKRGSIKKKEGINLKKSNNKSHGSLFLIIIVVVSIIVISGLIYYFYNSGILNHHNHSINNLNSENKTKNINNNVKIKVVTNEADFDKQLKQCKPNVAFNVTMMGITAYYKIIGKNDSYCDVFFKYLKLPKLSNWVNKSMICEMNGSLGIRKAFEDAMNNKRCHGKLYDTMTNINNYHNFK